MIIPRLTTSRDLCTPAVPERMHAVHVASAQWQTAASATFRNQLFKNHLPANTPTYIKSNFFYLTSHICFELEILESWVSCIKCTEQYFTEKSIWSLISIWDDHHLHFNCHCQVNLSEPHDYQLSSSTCSENLRQRFLFRPDVLPVSQSKHWVLPWKITCWTQAFFTYHCTADGTGTGCCNISTIYLHLRCCALVADGETTCQALLKRCPARIMWNAYLRIIGVLILMKQWAACSSSRALRRSDSCTQSNTIHHRIDGMSVDDGSMINRSFTTT